MKAIAPVSITALGATIVLALVLVSTEASITADASEPGGMDAMSIDMDPHGVPANTATSIGSREFCARINENDILDADEDDVDTLEIDVTTGPQGIPESNPMGAFSFSIHYEVGQIQIVSNDVAMLLAAGPDSSILDASDSLPDVDGRFTVNALDLATNTEGNVPEAGPGMLSRLRIESTPDSRDGIHHLLLERAGHISLLNEAHAPLTLNHAIVAIGVECPLAQPTPLPTPTPSPTPTTMPTPTPGKGPARISLGSDTTVPGGPASVSVSVIPGQSKITRLELTVSFDPSLVTGVGCGQHGDFDSCNASAPDHVRFSGWEKAGFDGIVGEIEFRAGDVGGTFDLFMEVTKATDPFGNPVEFIVETGSVTIINPTTPIVTPRSLPTAGGADSDARHDYTAIVALIGIGAILATARLRALVLKR